MSNKKLVEHNALIQAVEMGHSKEELMEKFGYRSLGSLKADYLNALIALGKVPDLNKKNKEKKVSNVVNINNRGSLVIPKKLVDSLMLNKSDNFIVEKSDTGVYLKIAEEPPKTILRKRNR